MYEEYFKYQMFLEKYLLFFDNFIVFYVFSTVSIPKNDIVAYTFGCVSHYINR